MGRDRQSRPSVFGGVRASGHQDDHSIYDANHGRSRFPGGPLRYELSGYSPRSVQLRGRDGSRGSGPGDFRCHCGLRRALGEKSFERQAPPASGRHAGLPTTSAVVDTHDRQSGKETRGRNPRIRTGAAQAPAPDRRGAPRWPSVPARNPDANRGSSPHRRTARQSRLLVA